MHICESAIAYGHAPLTFWLGCTTHTLQPRCTPHRAKKERKEKQNIEVAKKKTTRELSKNCAGS